jgi:hypothetical protein
MELYDKATTNGQSTAFPTDIDDGLTKREWFAGMALQGIIAACGNSDGVASYKENAVAINAITAADELLKQLAESDGK